MKVIEVSCFLFFCICAIIDSLTILTLSQSMLGLQDNLPSSFQWDVIKTLIGSFAGAFLAFISNQYFQNKAISRDNLSAGYRALFLIRSQLDDFLNVRRAMYKSLDDINTKLNGEPEWVLAKPISYDFNSSNVFDYKSLAFLLSIQSGREVFTRLQLAERAYLDLMSGLSEFNESALEKQKKMATSQLGENNFASLGEIERYIGVELVARTRDQLRGIVVKLAHDESRYIKAFESLNRVLVEIFCPDYEVQKIVIQERHAIAQLPNLPDNLKKHVAEQNIDIE